MDDLFGKIFSAATGVWAIFCALMVALFKAWPSVMGRLNERARDVAAEKASDWTRLRDENKRLDDRCQRLEIAEERCREELADVKNRLSVLEGYNIGRGSANQEAQMIVSTERTKPENKK